MISFGLRKRKTTRHFRFDDLHVLLPTYNKTHTYFFVNAPEFGEFATSILKKFSCEDAHGSRNGFSPPLAKPSKRCATVSACETEWSRPQNAVCRGTKSGTDRQSCHLVLLCHTDRFSDYCSTRFSTRFRLAVSRYVSRRQETTYLVPLRFLFVRKPSAESRISKWSLLRGQQLNRRNKDLLDRCTQRAERLLSPLSLNPTFT